MLTARYIQFFLAKLILLPELGVIVSDRIVCAIRENKIPYQNIFCCLIVLDYVNNGIIDVNIHYLVRSNHIQSRDKLDSLQPGLFCPVLHLHKEEQRNVAGMGDKIYLNNNNWRVRVRVHQMLEVR